MKRTIIMVSALAIALSSGIALAGGGGGGGNNKNDAPACDGSAAVICADDATKTCPAYDLVSPVTADQAPIIIQGHFCSGQTAADLAMIFMSAGLTEVQIQAQIDAAK